MSLAPRLVPRRGLSPALVLTAALLGAAPAAAAPAILGLTRPMDEAALAAEVAAAGGELRSCFARAGVCTADFPGEPPLGALRALPGMRYAEADALMAPLPAAVAAAATCGDGWELDAVRAPDAWALVDGASGPLVAVQDSGFRVSHEDLLGAVNSQWDYGNGDPIAEVEPASGVPGHGTFIAGLISARDNAVGRTGLAYGGQLYLQKIADDGGALYFSYAIDAVANLATKGADRVRVLNYSIASNIYNEGLADAMAALADLDNGGVLIVAAAANCAAPGCFDANNDSYPVYPANLDLPNVLSVANHDASGGLNAYSHYGPTTVDLAAPGTDLCSLDVTSDAAYLVASGTSYAAPLVAGVAALVLELHPDLTAHEAARVLRSSAAPEAALAGKVLSGGRLDAARALGAAVARLAPVGDVDLDDEGTLRVEVDNPAADGEVALLMLFGPGVSVLDAPGAVVEPLVAGQEVALPGEGPFEAPTDGALVSFALPAHATTAVELTLRAEVDLDTTATVRAVASSPGVEAWLAPEDGAADATGAPALTFALTGRAAPADTEEPEDTGPFEETAVVDSGDPAPGPAPQDSAPPEDTAGKVEPATGCGCHSVPATAPASALGLLALALARRRRSSEQP